MSELPDLSVYLRLVRSFLDGRIGAEHFARQYMGAIKKDPRSFERSLSRTLSELFIDCDDYVDDPTLRTQPCDLDEATLRQRAAKALGELVDLLGEGGAGDEGRGRL